MFIELPEAMNSRGREMKKRKFALIVFLAIIIISFLFMQWPRPTIVKMGEPIHLDVEDDKNTAGILGRFYRNFGWYEGSCDITVLDCALYDSPTDLGIFRQDICETANNQTNHLEFLYIHIKVTNNNAVSINDDKSMNIGFINLVPASFFRGLGVFNSTYTAKYGQIIVEYDPNVAYFSGYTEMQEGDRTDPYFHFKLNQGETCEYQLGFYIDKEYLEDNEMVLSYGINKYASTIEVRDETKNS